MGLRFTQNSYLSFPRTRESTGCQILFAIVDSRFRGSDGDRWIIGFALCSLKQAQMRAMPSLTMDSAPPAGRIHPLNRGRCT